MYKRQILDSDDAFPLDASSSGDYDNDGQADSVDLDDDGDGVLDIYDAFPLNSAETGDFDGDGIGDNQDLDDDNDGFLDILDANPRNAGINSQPPTTETNEEAKNDSGTVTIDTKWLIALMFVFSSVGTFVLISRKITKNKAADSKQETQLEEVA